MAAHRPPKDHDADIRTGLARATRPDLVTHLLCRAADLLRPTGPAPVNASGTDEADQ